MGLAVRGRERADHAPGGARSRRRAGSRSGRPAEAKGLCGAARGLQDRRPARGAEGARQAEDWPVEISALDRCGGRSAENRDREDPAIQAAGWGALETTIVVPAKQGPITTGLGCLQKASTRSLQSKGRGGWVP